MDPSMKSRNPWPIAIIVFFVVFFSGLVSFIVFAAHQHVDLVRSDYYEEEIRFQQQLDRVERTRQIAEPVAVTYDTAGRGITIKLPAAHAQPKTGLIHLYRPSDARLDYAVPLAPDSDGSQRLDASKLRSGLWKVRVQWSVEGQEYYFDQKVIVPHSNHS
jgi:hypothetical protein